jgi:hypothetical protein
LTTTKQRLPKLDMLMDIPTIWCHFHIAFMLHSNKLMHLPTVDTISTTQTLQQLMHLFQMLMPVS